MVTTAHIGVTLVEQAQAQKEVTVNEGMIRLEALQNTAAKDKELISPPASPASGDVYIVGSGATGDWAGRDGEVAYYAAGAWQFIAPATGLRLWVADEARGYLFQDGQWHPEGWIHESSGEYWRPERLEIIESGLSGLSVTTGLQIPERVILCAVHCRVLTAITGASSFSVGYSGSTTTYGSGIGVVQDATNIGVATPEPLFSPRDILLTANGSNFTGGEVQLVAHFMRFRGPWDW